MTLQSFVTSIFFFWSILQSDFLFLVVKMSELPYTVWILTLCQMESMGYRCLLGTLILFPFIFYDGRASGSPRVLSSVF